MHNWYILNKTYDTREVIDRLCILNSFCGYKWTVAKLFNTQSRHFFNYNNVIAILLFNLKLQTERKENFTLI